MNMSEENRKTLAAYDKTAQRYLDNLKNSDSAKDPVKAQKKRERFENALKKGFSSLPTGAKILEVGAADGVNSAFLESLGYEVIASDVAEAFIKALEARGLNAQKFNLLEDDFPKDLSGILCWRVFVHFTPEDIALALKRSYDALLPNGRMVINVIDRANHDCDAQWIDFGGDHAMGADRYYAYYSGSEILELINQSKFKIAESWREEGGHNNWFVYVLEK